MEGWLWSPTEFTRDLTFLQMIHTKMFASLLLFSLSASSRLSDGEIWMALNPPLINKRAILCNVALLFPHSCVLAEPMVGGVIKWSRQSTKLHMKCGKIFHRWALDRNSGAARGIGGGRFHANGSVSCCWTHPPIAVDSFQMWPSPFGSQKLSTSAIVYSLEPTLQPKNGRHKAGILNVCTEVAVRERDL